MKKKLLRVILKMLYSCILSFGGCDFSFCGREVEVIPGMTWKYFSLRHSRVVWDKYGVIAEGDVFISFYEYGFSFSCNGECKYIDAVQNVLVSDEEELGEGERYSAMDASSAVGAFSRTAHMEFLEELSALRERVKRRAFSSQEK